MAGRLTVTHPSFLRVTFLAIKLNATFPQIDLKLALSLISSCFKAEITKKKEGKKGCGFLGTLPFYAVQLGSKLAI